MNIHWTNLKKVTLRFSGPIFHVGLWELFTFGFLDLWPKQKKEQENYRTQTNIDFGYTEICS